MLKLAEVVQQIDELFAQNQGKAAEELMKQTIVRAVEGEDDNALLTMLNELIGYYRETSQAEASYQLADQAMQLLAKMGLEGTVPYATTVLNIANAYRAGGRLEDSLACYRKTKEIYDRVLSADDMLVASFYNNMSLLYQELQDHQEAKRCLLAALAIVKQHEDAYYELAATYTNLASSCLECDEDEEASRYFRLAIEILEAHGIENAHYSAALSSLGTFYYKKGDYRRAAQNFRKAMECMRRSLGENEFYQRLKENLKACEKALQEKENGLELSRAYYEAYGRPMLEERFAPWLDRIAVGLVGEGSDCFGFDDELSRDHDWGPDFCIWVTQETEREIGAALREAYASLPAEFMGYQRSAVMQGTGRRGVQTIQGFCSRLLGEGDWEKPDVVEATLKSETFWRQAADASLAAAVNGEVYADPEGIFSAVRDRLREGYPEQIRLLKLAENTAAFSQNGQYNYERMLQRGDRVAAQMMLGDCLKAAAKLVYYMGNKYPPHEKWLVKGLEKLAAGPETAALLDRVVAVSIVSASEASKAEAVTAVLEEAAQKLARELYRIGVISDVDPYLDHHTEELLRKAGYAALTDEELVERIVKLEYTAFDKVHNAGGRAFCQDDWRTFSIMRKSQYLTFTRPMLLQYLYDFQREYDRGHNLIEEKYGRMMESTAPEEYEQIKAHFPELSEEKKAIIEAVAAMQVGWMEEFERNFPVLAGNARSIHTAEDHLYNTSYETYLRGELGTYSDKMLELYGRYVVEYAREGRNLACDIMGNSVKMYGYRDLEDAEQHYAPPQSICRLGE